MKLLLLFFLFTVNPPPPYSAITPGPGHWPGDPTLSSVHGSDSEYRSEQNTLSSTQPDVTLSAQEMQGITRKRSKQFSDLLIVR